MVSARVPSQSKMRPVVTGGGVQFVIIVLYGHAAGAATPRRDQGSGAVVTLSHLIFFSAIGSDETRFGVATCGRGKGVSHHHRDASTRTRTRRLFCPPRLRS